jgi:hypothetical protein
MIRPAIQGALVAAVLASVISTTPIAAQKIVPQPSVISDATWTREFASAYTPSNDIGNENQLNGDSRFTTLLKTSFPQRQWFWRENYRFISVPDLVQTFIGVPGDAILDDQRYVTADGCVPHDCNDRGMLWIDTAAHPAKLIFVGTASVRTGPADAGSRDRLWLFSSSKLDFQNLPQPFLTSLRRWKDRIAASNYNGTAGYHYNFILATIVQPSGEMIDISPALLHLDTTESGAKQ